MTHSDHGKLTRSDRWGILIGLVVVAGMIGGAFAGIVGAVWAARRSGLLDLEPALVIPVVVLGIAVGGLGGLFVPLGLAALPRLVRTKGAGGAAGLVLRAAGATVLGAVCYLAVVGVLVWLVGLVLPAIVTTFVACGLSIAGLPFVGPIAFQLVSGRRADETGGGLPMPGWVYRIRRRRPSTQ